MYLTVTKPRHRCATVFNGGLDRFMNEFMNFPAMVESEIGWVPRADVHEDDEKYTVQMDLPGLDKSDVKVKFEDDTLTVSGERKFENKTDEKNFHRVERIYGSFSRSLRLEKVIDAEKISANFKNGVLEITLSKAEVVKPKEIEIKVG